MKKKICLIFILIFTAMSGFAESLPAPATSLEPINRVVAVVNTSIITQSELDRAINATIAQFQQRGVPLPDKASMEKKTLDVLIDQKLQLSLAEQNHITTSDEAVDKAIAEIAKRNHATVAELKKKLAQDGISFEEFKEQTRDQMTIMTLDRQALGSKINISNADVDAFKKKLDQENKITRYHVVDYVIPDADKAKALKLMQALKQGNQSPDLSDAEAHQLGWRTLDEIPDAFASHLVNLEDNGVAGPILTGNGYHVIQLLGTRQTSSEITLNQARNLLYQKQFQQALSEWLQELRANAYIKIYLKS